MAFCKSPAATVKRLKPIKLNERHVVMLEIQGHEVVGTLDGQSVILSKALIGAGTEAGFRKPRVWEALPNAEQGRNKAKLTTTALP